MLSPLAKRAQHQVGRADELPNGWSNAAAASGMPSSRSCGVT
jgi:hypothetical protein